MSAHLLRLNRRVLTVFLLVSVPILIFGVALVLTIGQARLRDSYGRQIEDVARQTAASVDAYVFRRLIDVSLIGRSPELRRVAAEATTQPLKMPEVQALDRSWTERSAEKEKAALLRAPASRYLADLVAHDRTYREMLLTDRYGRLVAASNETSDYFQGDEDWWKAAAAADRAPGVSLTDVRWDDSSRTYAVEIAVPVYEPDSEVFAGILKAVVDSRELLATVGGSQLGTSGQAVLLRENGSIVFSRQTSDPNARFFALDDLRERVKALTVAGSAGGRHFEAVGPDGQPHMVAVAASQLGRSYPNVAWVVAVSQAESEFLAPLQQLGWYLLLVVALTIAGLLVAAAYMSMRLASPQLQEDLQLVEHARVSHVGDEEEEATAVGDEEGGERPDPAGGLIGRRMETAPRIGAPSPSAQRYRAFSSRRGLPGALLRRTHLLDDGGGLLCGRRTLEAHHGGVLAPDHLGHEEAEVQPGLLQRVGERHTHAGLVVSLDEQAGQRGRRQSGGLCRVRHPLSRDRVHLDDGLTVVAGNAVAHQHLEVRACGGERSQRLRESSWLVLDLLPPNRDRLHRDCHAAPPVLTDRNLHPAACARRDKRHGSGAASMDAWHALVSTGTLPHS